MIIIEKPYVSNYLIETIVRNDWAVMENDVIEESAIEEGAIELIPQDIAKSYYTNQEFPMIYSNSENSISWILDNLPKSNLAEYIKVFKDKVVFRELLREIYPDFYYRSEDYKGLKSLKTANIKFPIIIKPAVGFLSVGVHKIYSASEWKKVLSDLDREMKSASSLYPSTVVDSSKFIIEEIINGDEYAIDAFFDRNGEPVILNIFKHQFLDENDVSDRIYVTSAEIISKHLSQFTQLLQKIGKLKNIRNFPLHMEVRVDKEGKCIPIEVNPMRFAGWCTTDVAQYAWGINVYEYYYRQKRPNWTEILSQSDNRMYYFSMAEVPAGKAPNTINGFDYKGFLANYSNVLELRRINYKKNTLFAVIFGVTDDKDEISQILALKTKDYIL